MFQKFSASYFGLLYLASWYMAREQNIGFGTFDGAQDIWWAANL